MVAFVASTVLTAANLNTAFNALTIRTVILTSDTLVLADNGGAVTYSNASATTSTIPPNSSVAYAVGTKIILANLGAGVVTVTPGSGVTVNGTLTIAQNAGGTCLKTATNTWSFLPFGSGTPTLTSADVSSTTGSPTITTSGANTIYKFTGSGTIVLGKAGLCSVLAVGAGAGGGRGNASQGSGGGGAGGYLTMTGEAYLLAGTLTITVAAGGAGATGLYQVGQNGNTSRLSNYYSPGGGGGGGYFGIVALGFGNIGASGGGSTEGVAGGTGTSPLGNNGGASTVNTNGGGGGGSSAVGVNGATTVAGAGGAGTANTITGSSVTYAGGGGGGATGTGGAGGTGGGGAGAAGAVAGSNGSANTGGGGGGGGTGTSGAGGSGVVIISVTT